MIIPSILPVLAPIVLYFIIFAIGGQVAALASVGAMLLGVINTGLYVADTNTAGAGPKKKTKINNIRTTNKIIERGLIEKIFGGVGTQKVPNTN